jgi:hypothetical protein
MPRIDRKGKGVVSIRWPILRIDPDTLEPHIRAHETIARRAGRARSVAMRRTFVTRRAAVSGRRCSAVLPEVHREKPAEGDALVVSEFRYNTCSGFNLISRCETRMTMAATNAVRRMAMLRRFYDGQHSNSRGSIKIEPDPAFPWEEQLIDFNICRQLHEQGLINWKGSSRGTEEPMTAWVGLPRVVSI